MPTARHNGIATRQRPSPCRIAEAQSPSHSMPAVTECHLTVTECHPHVRVPLRSQEASLSRRSAPPSLHHIRGIIQFTNNCNTRRRGEEQSTDPATVCCSVAARRQHKGNRQVTGAGRTDAPVAEPATQSEKSCQPARSVPLLSTAGGWPGPRPVPAERRIRSARRQSRAAPDARDGGGPRRQTPHGSGQPAVGDWRRGGTV